MPTPQLLDNAFQLGGRTPDAVKLGVLPLTDLSNANNQSLGAVLRINAALQIGEGNYDVVIHYRHARPISFARETLFRRRSGSRPTAHEDIVRGGTPLSCFLSLVVCSCFCFLLVFVFSLFWCLFFFLWFLFLGLRALPRCF